MLRKRPTNPIIVTVRINEELSDALDYYCYSTSRTRSEAIRLLVDGALIAYAKEEDTTRRKVQARKVPPSEIRRKGRREF
jgi:metal-responsive CopG/Arc/MetJ family transcriptional regulator